MHGLREVLMELPERQPCAPGGAASKKVGKMPLASLLEDF